jgi:hypothetical protein
VLIAAVSGTQQLKSKALTLLADPGHTFVYDPFLKLEVLLLPTFNRREIEIQFHEAYFKSATCFGDLNRMFEIGQREAYLHGIAVLDAMHVATTHLMRCDALVTLEIPSKPMFRSNIAKVISLR